MIKMKSIKIKNLYFFAIVLKGEIGDLISNYKKHMAETYNSKAALRSPPHITLHMPFKKFSRDEDRMSNLLKEIGYSNEPFNLRLINFNCFKPRVIFIDLEPSKPLIQLQKNVEKIAKIELNLFNASHKGRPFKPHITIAFRDLSKEGFGNAWKEFETKDIDHRYQVDSISLLKHDSNKWIEIFETKLGSC